MAVVLAQGTLTRYFQVFEYFDLPLIYSIYYGFTRGNQLGALGVGSAFGLLQDSLSGVELGTNGFTKALIAFLAASAGWKFDVDQSVTRILAFVAFTFLDAVLKVLLASIAELDPAAPFRVTLAVWLLSAAFNVMLGMVLFGYRDRFSSDATT